MRHLDLSSQAELVLPNVARGKPASQVSTSWGGVPERAVDGNTGGNYLQDNTASHTAEPAAQAWWQADLGQAHTLAEMEIWNRSDCCTQRLSNYWIVISPSAITTSSLADALATPGVVASTAPTPPVVRRRSTSTA